MQANTEGDLSERARQSAKELERGADTRLRAPAEMDVAALSRGNAIQALSMPLSLVSLGRLPEEFLKDLLGADVQIDLRGLKPVVTEDLLEGNRAEASLDAIHGEGAAKRMGCDGLRDHGPVG
jgi:hypothetical protein